MGRIRHTGYMLLVDDKGRHEADTFTCAHCQRIVRIQKGSGRTRGWCGHCGKPVCGNAVCMKSCTPFMKKVEAQERSSEIMRRLGLGNQ